jgi:maltose alpha-D-glucosyltransferase / alpha-amylase
MAAAAAMRVHAEQQLQLLEASLPRIDEGRRRLAQRVLNERGDLVHFFDDVRRVRRSGLRIRCHGDYHLGQVLVSEGDVIILDFEGEPARPLAERRARSSPLRDVAGMLRSFAYAALTGLNVATLARPKDRERLEPWANLWETWVSAAFMRAYLAAVRDLPLLPVGTDLETLLQMFVIDKTFYELGYELNNRPEWVHIPLSGLLAARLHSRAGTL